MLGSGALAVLLDAESASITIVLHEELQNRNSLVAISGKFRLTDRVPV